MAQKKRKISNLTAGDANALIAALATFQATLDEDDEELPPELLPALDKLRAKVEVVPHTSFSKADHLSLATTAIKLDTLILIGAKRGEIETLGIADAPGSFLSFDATSSLIKLIRSHVSLVTAAGCRVLITMILLRLSSTMQSENREVNILPEFPISKTVFETAAGTQSFSGVVDFLLALVPPRISKHVLQSPVGTLVNPDKMRQSLTPTIIEAKKDDLAAAIPQAGIAVASYCKQNKLASLRGCVTSGEQWIFFAYRCNAVGADQRLSFSEQFDLGTGLENLPLILGLLTDLVENALIAEQRFFEDF